MLGISTLFIAISFTCESLELIIWNTYESKDLIYPLDLQNIQNIGALFMPQMFANQFNFAKPVLNAFVSFVRDEISTDQRQTHLGHKSSQVRRYTVVCTYVLVQTKAAPVHIWNVVRIHFAHNSIVGLTIAV